MKIQKTNNYYRFNSVDGNRNVNEAHVNRLVKSFEEEFLISPITVNKEMEVVDGQHRLEACKRLGLPVYYFVVDSYKREQVQRLNVNTRNWNAEDFVTSMVACGNQHYEILKDYKETYKIPYTSCISILSGGVGNIGSDSILRFKEGRFECKEVARAKEFGEFVLLSSEFFEKSNGKSYIMALLKCFDNEAFSVSEYIHKLKMHASLLDKCRSSKQYLETIEEIYNYDRRGKVNLRF